MDTKKNKKPFITEMNRQFEEYQNKAKKEKEEEARKAKEKFLLTKVFVPDKEEILNRNLCAHGTTTYYCKEGCSRKR